MSYLFQSYVTLFFLAIRVRLSLLCVSKIVYWNHNFGHLLSKLILRCRVTNCKEHENFKNQRDSWIWNSQSWTHHQRDNNHSNTFVSYVSLSIAHEFLNCFQPKSWLMNLWIPKTLSVDESEVSKSFDFNSLSNWFEISSSKKVNIHFALICLI